VAQAVRHAGMVRAGHAAAPQKSVTVHVHMHNVRLTGGKAEFDKFMGDFTKEVERAMHTAVKVVTP
jgi:predicted SnoaL-like aldol condensation-catalyzing enzyme